MSIFETKLYKNKQKASLFSRKSFLPGTIVSIIASSVIGKMQELNRFFFKSKAETSEVSNTPPILPDEDKKNSEQDYLYKTLVFIPDTVLNLDRSGKILFSNKKNLFKGNDVEGSFITDYVTAEYGEQVKKALKKVFECSMTEVFELALPGEDGLLWLLTKTGPVISDSKVVSALMTLTDITVRKNTEEELRISEDIKNRVVQSVPGGIVMVSPDGSILEANKTARDILGISYDEITKKFIDDFQTQTIFEDGTICPVEEYPVFRCLKTGQEQPPLTIGVKKPDGRISWAIFTAIPVKNPVSGEKTGALVTFVDITERKQMEQRLKESEESFRVLSSAAFEGVVISENFKIVDLNEACANLVGMTREELIGADSLKFILPEEHEKIKLSVTTNSEEPYESVAVRKDGTHFPIEVQGRAAAYNGRPARISVVRDITKYREAVAEIRKSLTEKEILLKEIHHRVKNNLQIISSLLFLQTQYVKDDRLKEILRESQNRIKSIALIHEKIYQARDLSKIDFYEYVERLTAHILHVYIVNSRKVTLRIDIGKIMIDVSTALPCGLIINELMTNSIKYAFEKQDAGNITISLKEEEETLLLTFSDNGSGIPENIEIFDADTMGLQLVTLLTEQISGKLEFSRNNGSEFRISFPKTTGLN